MAFLSSFLRSWLLGGSNAVVKVPKSDDVGGRTVNGYIMTKDQCKNNSVFLRSAGRVHGAWPNDVTPFRTYGEALKVQRFDLSIGDFDFRGIYCVVEPRGYAQARSGGSAAEAGQHGFQRSQWLRRPVDGYIWLKSRCSTGFHLDAPVG